MSELSRVTTMAGTLIILLAIPLVFNPARAAEWLKRFPRSVWAGRILTAVGLAWATRLLFRAPPWNFRGLIEWLLAKAGFLGFLLGPLLDVEDFKPMLWVLAPVSYFLIIVFVDELLAPRALGGMLLLAAAPVLDAARWHESNWRLVMTVTAYGVVIVGIILTAAPYHFRRGVRFWIEDCGRCRLAGIGIAVFGLVILALGLGVY